MSNPALLNQTIAQDYIEVWIWSFIEAKRSENKSKHTLKFYRNSLKTFTDFCDAEAVKGISQITPNFIREFLLYLDDSHDAGGVHVFYRSLKAFLNWYWEEAEPDYPNPINKVKAPKVPLEILEPVSLDDIEKLLDRCDVSLLGKRDKAIFLALLDTGVRASELVAIQLADVNLITGDVIIRKGKGGKGRIVYLGQKSRKTIRQYIKLRRDNSPALFATDDGEKLTYWGLRQIIRRRAEQAGINVPEIHAFRRAFAINSWRQGMDVFSIAAIMGHSPSSIQVLVRYLKQTAGDLRQSHTSLADGL